MKTAITERLDALKIDDTVKPHSQPVYTSEAAARERGVRLSRIVKTLLLMDRQDRMLVAVLPGKKHFDMVSLQMVVDFKPML